MRIRIRIQQLKLMWIHADPDPVAKPCYLVTSFFNEVLSLSARIFLQDVRCHERAFLYFYIFQSMCLYLIAKMTQIFYYIPCIGKKQIRIKIKSKGSGHGNYDQLCYKETGWNANTVQEQKKSLEYTTIPNYIQVDLYDLFTLCPPLSPYSIGIPDLM
jgi:hypothetical protein